MSEPKWKTETTSGDIKPTKVGTYKRIINEVFYGEGVYSYWGGTTWMSYTDNFDDAICSITESDYQDLPWFDIEEDKPKFEAMKFRVKNPEESKLVQEKLFEMGYTWASYGAIVSYSDRDFLYTCYSGHITYSSIDGSSDRYFENHRNKEVLVTVKTTVEFAEVPVEYITIDGKEYPKNAILSAISQAGVKAK
jgi:hypothetical protein